MTSLPVPPAWSPGAVNKVCKCRESCRDAAAKRSSRRLWLRSLSTAEHSICPGWVRQLAGLHFRPGGGQGRWSLFRFRVGGLRKPPVWFLGREGMWEDLLSRLSPPTAESWSPVGAGALPGVTWPCLGDATTRRNHSELGLCGRSLFSYEVISDCLPGFCIAVTPWPGMDCSVRPSYFERHNNDCKDWEKKKKERERKG